MLTLITYAEALTDILDIADHIALLDGLDASVCLLKSVESACELLASWPETGTRYALGNPAYSHVRLFAVPEYSQFIIFYVEKDGELRLARVLHCTLDMTDLLFSEAA